MASFLGGLNPAASRIPRHPGREVSNSAEPNRGAGSLVSASPRAPIAPKVEGPRAQTSTLGPKRRLEHPGEHPGREVSNSTDPNRRAGSLVSASLRAWLAPKTKARERKRALSGQDEANNRPRTNTRGRRSTRRCRPRGLWPQLRAAWPSARRRCAAASRRRRAVWWAGQP